MKKTTFIYILYKNEIPFYIGKTTNSLRKREREHQYKYGYDIVLETLDECRNDKQIWKPLECYWIQQFKAWGFELVNQNEGGGGPELHSKESRLKISLNRRNKCNKPIIQYDLNGKFIKEWNSISEADLIIRNKKEGSTSIGSCLEGKTSKAYGYIWRYKCDDIRKLDLPIHKFCKRVEQYSINNEFIKEYTSATEVKKLTGIDPQHVLLGKYKTAGGYIFKYILS